MTGKQDLANTSLVARILDLERRTALLDPVASERQVLMEKVGVHAQNFLGALDTAPAYCDPADGPAAISQWGIAEEGRNIDEVLDLLAKHYDRSGVVPTSPRYMAYIPAGGLFHAALGDFLAAVTNPYAGMITVAPSAARIESDLVRWMGDIVGLPAGFAGTLTSGGSIAHLTAIVAARDACDIEPDATAGVAVYKTSQTHHCIEKAMRIAGLKRVKIRQVAVDEGLRMRADALEEMIVQDRRNFIRPWLVVGTAGTTNSGAVDPLAEIAAVCKRHGLWFHVDAAYGGMFALCAEGRNILRGMELADTIVLDPHKGLFLPYGTGAVIARDGEKLWKSFADEADYMKEPDGRFSASNLSPELTRHFRGMRLWMSLQLGGVASFRAALEEKLLLARHARERLKALADFEVGPEPDLSVVTFRFLPSGIDAEKANKELEQELKHGGKMFLSSTTIEGRRTLRLAILSFRTHLHDVDCAIDEIATVAEAIRLH